MTTEGGNRVYNDLATFMLRVKTRIGPSRIDGIGLFACDPIPKGTLIWRFTPGLDLRLDTGTLHRRSQIERDFLLRYCYLSPRMHAYVLHADGARFINHSATPNVGSVPDPGRADDSDVALRDIAAGEELTADYRDCDTDYARKLPPSAQSD